MHEIISASYKIVMYSAYIHYRQYIDQKLSFHCHLHPSSL